MSGQKRAANGALGGDILLLLIADVIDVFKAENSNKTEREGYLPYGATPEKIRDFLQFDGERPQPFIGAAKTKKRKRAK